MKKKKNGFTLVELIIVISLLVVIAGMFTMSLIKTLNQRKEEENKDIVAQIVSAANTYVSINPEEIENLYNGYGYVDIPIGELRDKGLLSEDLKNAESGKKIPDDDKVRVKLDLGDYLDFTYPIDKNLENTEAWKFIAEDLYIDYTRNQTDWCSVSENVFAGLVTNPNNASYKNFKSKMYLMNNKEGDPDQARMYVGNYFDKNKVNLRVTSCNVNPNKVGTYNITYKYNDKDLGTEKTVNRVVYVNSSNEDLMGFTVTINKGQPIVRGTPNEQIPVLIKEIYRNGAKDIPTTVGGLAGKGYNIVDLATETVGKNFVATVTRIIANSDGTYPNPQKPLYEIIPDTYTLTLNPGNGTVTPKSKIVTYGKLYGELPTPLRTGYNFIGWFADSGQQVTSETKMIKLFDHTIYARWTPQVFTVIFNANGGAVGIPTKNVTYDSTYGDLPVPTREGYDFSGWYTDPTGGNVIADNTVVQILANQTLYAHWVAKTYDIKFESNGCGNVNQDSKKISYDGKLGILPSANKNEYIFIGWYTDADGGIKLESNTTFTKEIENSSSNTGTWESGNLSPGTGNSSSNTGAWNSGNLSSGTGNSSSNTGAWNSGTNDNSITLYAHCTYKPEPEPEPYEPPFSRPERPSIDDERPNKPSGSSSTSTSCTVSCGNGCGDRLASADACSDEYNELKGAGKLTDEEADRLHETAMSERNQAMGGDACGGNTGKECDKVEYDGNTGVTTDLNGNRLTPKYPGKK